MAVDTEVQRRRSNGRTRLAVVDTDVHHGIRDKKDLLPYLPHVYRERFADYGLGGGGGVYANNGGQNGKRVDAIGPDDPATSGTATVNPERCVSQLLDGVGIDTAILTGVTAYPASWVTDQDYASAVCRAFNEFTLEHWLSVDSRFRYAIAISHQDPVGAAKEIDRIGDDPRVVGVLMPCGAPRPFGNRFYHPIYEACERHGLTVCLHFSGEGAGINGPPTSAGFASYYAEARQMRPAFYQVHLASFIFEGVFERFPTLKVAMLEGGFGWVPVFRWKMDADWKGLRHQTPWVRRLPSEYILEHVRFASQPVDEPDVPDALLKLVEWMQGERTLMYASDYPHWDWDDPAEVFKTFPAALRQRIFVDNARESFAKL
jgi:predicted TIM-barrel fold metal-dependent hydrolase